MQPINYMAAMPQIDLSQQFSQLGATLGEIGKQRQMEERARQIQQQYATDVEAALSDGSPGALARLIAKYPQQREALGDVAKMVSKDKLDQEFGEGLQISSAFESGNVGAARSIVERRSPTAHREAETAKAHRG